MRLMICQLVEEPSTLPAHCRAVGDLSIDASPDGLAHSDVNFTAVFLSTVAVSDSEI